MKARGNFFEKKFPLALPFKKSFGNFQACFFAILFFPNG